LITNPYPQLGRKIKKTLKNQRKLDLQNLLSNNTNRLKEAIKKKIDIEKLK